MLYGGRVSLAIGAATVGIAGTLGTTLGAAGAYFGGAMDDVIMRLSDAQLSIPFVLLAIAVVSAVGPGIPVLILVLVVTGWVIYARVARSVVLATRSLEYVDAARALGASHWRTLTRHIVPSIISPLIVVASFQLATMIFNEAALSFLGLGVRPPAASWGSMLGDGRAYMQVAWWLSTFPGAALTVTMLSINLIGDWLRDLFDPRLT
jgi:peptide/nickel transport system permease protein